MVLLSVQRGDAKLLNEEEIGTLPTGLLEIRSFGNFSPKALLIPLLSIALFRPRSSIDTRAKTLCSHHHHFKMKGAMS